MSSANRQGGPSSQRTVGGSSSPSVRRSRSRPVRASRSTTAACSFRSTNRRVPIDSPPLLTTPEPLTCALTLTAAAAGADAAAAGPSAGLASSSSARRSRSSGSYRASRAAGACHQGFKGPQSPAGPALAAGQVDDHLVLVEGRRDVEDVDQQAASCSGPPAWPGPGRAPDAAGTSPATGPKPVDPWDEAAPDRGGAGPCGKWDALEGRGHAGRGRGPWGPGPGRWPGPAAGMPGRAGGRGRARPGRRPGPAGRAGGLGPGPMRRARRIADQLQGADRRPPRAASARRPPGPSPRGACTGRRRPEVRARARRVEPAPAEPEPDPVLGRPPDPATTSLAEAEVIATRPLAKYDWPRERTASLKSRETFWAIPIIPSYSVGPHPTVIRIRDPACPRTRSRMPAQPTATSARLAEGSSHPGAPRGLRLRLRKSTKAKQSKRGRCHGPGRARLPIPDAPGLRRRGS